MTKTGDACARRCARHWAHAHAQPRPPGDAEGAAAARPTPEQIAKVVTAKLKSPVGTPEKAELALRVVLPRAVLERLMARSSRENYPSLAAWVQAVLEREGKG